MIWKSKVFSNPLTPAPAPGLLVLVLILILVLVLALGMVLEMIKKLQHVLNHLTFRGGRAGSAHFLIIFPH